MAANNAIPADVLRRAARYLERHGVESPGQTAEALLMHVLGTDRAGLYARREGLSSAEARTFGRALCQRCKGTPVQHITGEQGFMQLVLATEPGVFVPRPETEVLVEVALESIEAVRGPRVVDVGTGTGAIALAVKHARPDARVVATDASAPAVALARRNAARHGLDVDVLHGDLLAPVPGDLRGRLHLVASNPPYVTEEEYTSLPAEVRADPYEALVGGSRVHARLAEAADSWLAPGGWIVVETGADQASEVQGILGEAGLVDVEVFPDLAGRDRVVRGRRRTRPIRPR